MRRNAKVFALLVFLVALALASAGSTDCYTYSDSSPVDLGFENQGYACAGHGAGCSQCTDTWSNGGWRVCTYDQWGAAVDCFSYLAPPDNEGL
jgi:hypothetical protein